MQGRRKRGGWGGFSPPVFGQTVNPISTRGADYTHHSTTSPPGFSDLATGLICTGYEEFPPIKTSQPLLHQNYNYFHKIHDSNLQNILWNLCGTYKFRCDFRFQNGIGPIVHCAALVEVYKIFFMPYCTILTTTHDRMKTRILPILQYIHTYLARVS